MFAQTAQTRSSPAPSSARSPIRMPIASWRMEVRNLWKVATYLEANLIARSPLPAPASPSSSSMGAAIEAPRDQVRALQKADHGRGAADRSSSSSSCSTARNSDVMLSSRRTSFEVGAIIGRHRRQRDPQGRAFRAWSRGLGARPDGTDRWPASQA